MIQFNPTTDLDYFCNIVDIDFSEFKGGITKKLLEKYKPKRESNIVKPLDRISDSRNAA